MYVRTRSIRRQQMPFCGKHNLFARRGLTISAPPVDFEKLKIGKQQVQILQRFTEKIRRHVIAFFLRQSVVDACKPTRNFRVLD